MPAEAVLPFERSGWYEVDVTCLGEASWAELWFDLGLGLVRCHALPLGPIVDGRTGAMIRLHRRPVGLSLRVDCPQRIQPVLKARRISSRQAIRAAYHFAKHEGRPGSPSLRTLLSGMQVLPHPRDAKLGDPFSYRRNSLCGKTQEGGTTRLAICEAGGPDAAAMLNAMADQQADGWLFVVSEGTKVLRENLAVFHSALEGTGEAVLVYGDSHPSRRDQKTGRHGLRGRFCQHRLLAGEGLGGIYAVKTAAVRAVGGWHSCDREALHFGLWLRLYEWFGAGGLVHSPVTLAAGVPAEPPVGLIDKLRAQCVDRIGFPRSAYGFAPSGEQVDSVSVSVIIPTRDRLNLLSDAVAAVRRAKPAPFEIIVLDNGSTDPATLAWLDAESGRPAGLKVIRLPGSFNFAALCNAGAAAAAGSVLAFLNNDTLVSTPNLFSVCADMALCKGTGAVGPLLLYPGGAIQHAGITLGPGGVGGHVLTGRRRDTQRSDVFPLISRSVCALTAACLFVDREKFDQIDGFDEGLAVAFNDVDLCLRLADLGLNNVLIPTVHAIHLETQSREPDRHYDHEPRLRTEFERMRTRWGTRLDWDPWISTAIRVDKESASPFWGRHPSM